MSQLTWGGPGERKFKTGVSHGVLYLPDDGVYDSGYAWNGLVTVTESPTGGEPNAQYADNIKYINMVSPEEFAGTIEAFFSPPEFDACDGTVSPEPGVYVGQQGRQTFGFSWRSLIGNDTAGIEHGYEIHLAWGLDAQPSEKSHATVNESPEASTLSWEFTSTGVPVTGLRPTAKMTINSTEVDAGDLAALEALLYGTSETEPELPSPDEVIALFSS